MEALRDIAPESVIGFHELRTRRSGSTRYVDMHLVVPRDLTIAEVHAICDLVELKITEHLNMAHVLVHAEPCEDENCTSCIIGCTRIRNILSDNTP